MVYHVLAPLLGVFVCTASLCDGRLCHVQLILTYDISCVSLSDHMKLVYNVLALLLGLLVGWLVMRILMDSLLKSE